jgi:Skp family chaperone for outer membrane proteins
MAPVVQKVTNAINSVSKEQGMTFVFEQSMPLYVGADVVDITSLVKTSLGLK